MGAGVIPFSVNDQKVYFLFQTTFTGRKTGFLIDFGGGIGPGEDYRKTAIREFVEETETMYFSDDLKLANPSVKTIKDQISTVEALFEKTLSAHPDWWCNRDPGNPQQPKLWKTFFIEFPYRDIEAMNREWESDRGARFKKRRELFWIAADELLAIYDHTPDKLWKRVRQLENVRSVIHSIKQAKEVKAIIPHTFRSHLL